MGHMVCGFCGLVDAGYGFCAGGSCNGGVE